MVRNKPVIPMPKGVSVEEKPVVITRVLMGEVKIPGVGPDSETVTGTRGGKQSALPYAFHLLSPCAMFRIASILDEGALKYGSDNWRQIPIPEHINHALVHIFAYLHGDTQDDHLGHAFCRMMFALSLEIGTDPIKK